MPPPPPAEALEAAAAVFEGRVMEIEALGEPELGPRQQQVHVQVVRTFKGADQERLPLVTQGDSAMCGYPFQANKSYLIYAHGGGEQLRVSLCSRTRPIEKAEEDLDVLGMGYVPVEPVKTDTAPGDAPPSDQAADSRPANPTDSTSEPGSAAKQARPRGGCASCSVGDESDRTNYGSALPWAMILAGLGWATRRRQLG